MKAALSLCGGDQDYFGRNVAQMFLSVYRKVALPSSVPEAVWHLKSDCDSGHKFTLILKFHKHKINLVTGEQEGVLYTLGYWPVEAFYYMTCGCVREVAAVGQRSAVQTHL